MDFNNYREKIGQIGEMAVNFTRLNNSDLSKLIALKEECISLKEEAVNSFTKLVGEIEDSLTNLLEYFDQIKKELEKISGPEGTIEDTLRLETVWMQANELNKNIRSLIESGKSSQNDKLIDKSRHKVIINPVQKNNEKQIKDIKESINSARKEAAAASEQIAVNIKPVQKTIVQVADSKSQKKEIQDIKQIKKATPPKKEITPPAYPTKSLNLTKACGDAEQKLMEEINKNIELIKNNKKK
ncbi:MAG: hypothetical protein ACOY46_16995 [Bacillota bacterium]